MVIAANITELVLLTNSNNGFLGGTGAGKSSKDKTGSEASLHGLIRGPIWRNSLRVFREASKEFAYTRSMESRCSSTEERRRDVQRTFRYDEM